jgi:type III pantothenate kinase
MEKPCVVSRIGPHEELIEPGRSGFLVPPRDPAALTEAMYQVQEDSGWAQTLGKQARERVRHGFDAATCAEKLGELYERMIQEEKNR